MVYIEPYARYRVVDFSARERVLHEDPADFAVVPVNVVRPFYAYAVVDVAVKGVHHSKRHRFRQPELAAWLHVCRAQQHRHRDVFEVGAFPRVAPLSASCGLAVGVDNGAVDSTFGVLRQIGVGGAYRLKMDVCWSHRDYDFFVVRRTVRRGFLGAFAASSIIARQSSSERAAASLSFGIL